MMMLWNSPGTGWWDYAGMGIAMLVFWGLLITAVILLVRSDSADRHTVPPATYDAPEHVLADRFARGEIDEKEYRERVAVLRAQSRT